MTVRVAFDISILRHGLTGGTAQYAYNLCRALLELERPPEVKALFCARASALGEEAVAELAALGATIVRAPAPWRWSPDGAWWLPVRPPLGDLVRGVDVFHVGEFVLPPPRLAGGHRDDSTAFVATVHDLTTATHPEHHTRLNRAVHARRLRWIERHADRVIAVSGATRRDLVDRTGVVPERVDVVHEARTTTSVPDPAAGAKVLRRHGLSAGHYVLAVGTLEPRKNHARLLAAFERLPPRLGGLELVFAGAWGWRSSDLRRALERSPARQRVRVLGFVPPGELAALYAGAAAFAFPSLYEGFGLPLLEAMAAGAPILTAEVSSMPEVVGDAAVLVDPLSVDSIRAALQRLLEDDTLRGRVAAAGHARERGFTWRRAAIETLASYERALVARRGTAQDTPEAGGPGARQRLGAAAESAAVSG